MDSQGEHSKMFSLCVRIIGSAHVSDKATDNFIFECIGRTGKTDDR